MVLRDTVTGTTFKDRTERKKVAQSGKRERKRERKKERKRKREKKEREMEVREK